MAKIVILMGRASSGKTHTINKMGKKLNLTEYKTRNKGGYPPFITWAGEANEVFLKTSSIQEEAISEVRKVFAQTSSLQEKNKAILDKILEEVNDWLDFLKDKDNAIAIIPFTLTGGQNMPDLILKPLEVFRNSGNEVKVVYLRKENISQKEIVDKVVRLANPDKEIHSIKGEENEIRQANELIDYLNLKPIEESEIAPIEKFF